VSERRDEATERRAGRVLRALVVLTIAGATGMAGCGDDEQSGAAGSPSEPIEMSLAVSNYPTTSPSVPFVVAMEKGMFEEAGLRIEDVSGSAGGGDTVRSVLAGRLPFGDVSPTAAMQAYLAGAPVVIIGGGANAISGVKFVALADSDLRGIQDLAGRSVGYTSPGSVTQAVLELSMRRAGVDSSAVKTRAMGGLGEGLTALEGGAIDAAANVEPVFTSNPDPYRLLWAGTEYVPEYQQTVIISSLQYLQQNADVARRFLEARGRAIDYIAENPDEAAEAWATAADLDPAVTKRVIREYIEANEFGVGLTLEGMKAVDESMRMLEQTEGSEALPWKDVVNQDFLPAGVSKIDPSQIDTSG
jgi:NitT/TauT family transport system substrate-binding protein